MNCSKIQVIVRWIMILVLMAVGESVNTTVKFNHVEGEKRLAWKDDVVQNWVTSYYGEEFHGKETASGIVFDMYGETAAHKYIPFGTVLLLRNPLNGRMAFVIITDRGPFIEGRELDVSWGVAEKLGMLELGVCLIEVKIIQFPF